VKASVNNSVNKYASKPLAANKQTAPAAKCLAANKTVAKKSAAKKLAQKRKSAAKSNAAIRSDS